MTKSRGRLIKLVFAAILISIGYLGINKTISWYKGYVHEKTQQATINQITKADVVSRINPSPASDTNSETPKPTPITIKDKAYLEVPFVTQAPLENKANWVIHDESCEEAAVFQVIAYLNGTKEIDRGMADLSFQSMISWQVENFGEHRDIYAEELKEFILGYYPDISEDRVIIYKNASLEDIKKEISLGNPVIAPITGDLLKNPFYHYPGYHMLTVIGYTEDRLITNDVGTKRGKDFSYENERFMTAMEDAGSEIVVILPK